MRSYTIFLISLAFMCAIAYGNDSAQSEDRSVTSEDHSETSEDHSVEIDSKHIRFYKVNVDSGKQLKKLRALAKEFELKTHPDVDSKIITYDVLVNAEHQKQFEQRLKTYKIDFESHLATDECRECLVDIPIPTMNWTSYQPLQNIYEWFDYMNYKNDLLVELYTIGYSYEARPIKAAKVSYKNGKDKKAIFIEAGIHAIEWISSATATCFFNTLLTSNDREIRQLLENYDWIFVPMLNPDGYHYTRTVDKLWRKNRKPTGFSNSSGICYGTDLNRNFNFQWKAAGWNVDVPCDHWYGGPAVASEPEVQALEKFVRFFPEGYIRMYLALHSFGNLILLPQADNNDTADQMKEIGKGFADAAIVKYNTKFRYGSSEDLLYVVSGSSKDWAHGVMGIPFTATIELRDTGTYGFFLPAKQILEVCGEFTDGIIGMIKAAVKVHLFD